MNPCKESKVIQHLRSTCQSGVSRGSFAVPLTARLNGVNSVQKVFVHRPVCCTQQGVSHLNSSPNHPNPRTMSCTTSLFPEPLIGLTRDGRRLRTAPQLTSGARWFTTEQARRGTGGTGLRCCDPSETRRPVDTGETMGRIGLLFELRHAETRLGGHFESELMSFSAGTVWACFLLASDLGLT